MAPQRRQPIRRILTILLLALAWIAPGDSRAEEPDGVGLRAGARGVGEVWQDTWLTGVYRTSRFTGSAVMSYRAWRFLGAELEIGYERLAGNSRDADTGKTRADDARIEVVPISAMASASRTFGGTTAFCALGVALTSWGESSRDQEPLHGTQVGAAFQLGARIDTRLVQPSRRPGTTVQVQAVELELFAARRQHHLFGVGDGLDFSAWRFGVGLLARL